jgi:SAM-dependent methyltransferase
MTKANYWNKKWSANSRKLANNFAVRSYKLIKENKFKSLLDLGCGDGRDSIYFSKKGLKVTAVDFSKTAINRLKSSGNDIDCLVANIENIKLKANSFDVIYAHLSLHYFNDRTTEAILQNIHKALKKGGLLFIKCKSTDDFLYGKGKKIGENIYQDEHLRHFFTKDYLLAKLEKFKILKIRKSSSVYHQYKSSFIEAIATKK